jgi:hypothetical protein
VKWITRSHVHVDRVACPWLIARFVDSEAEFLFVATDSVLGRIGTLPRFWRLTAQSQSSVSRVVPL